MIYENGDNMQESIELEKEQYINTILQIANNPNLENKHSLLAGAFTNYYKFCYQQHLNSEDERLISDVLEDTSYIIESTPIIKEMDMEKVFKTIAHLKEVLEKRKNGIIEGITLEEANILLEYNVLQTRKNLIEYIERINSDYKIPKNVYQYSLSGLCGFVQSLSLIPLQELELEITINNVREFPNVKEGDGHAFGTVKIPIKERRNVYLKSYLVDVSYRQFFSTFKCHLGKFFQTDQNLETSRPEAGYYVCRTKEGIKLASELLKKGFIEWNPTNAKIYGDGFAYSSTISLFSTKDDFKKIQTVSGDTYLKTIEKKQSNLEYDKEELENDGYIIDLEDPILKR